MTARSGGKNVAFSAESQGRAVTHDLSQVRLAVAAKQPRFAKWT
jgi:hypothetical protein